MFDDPVKRQDPDVIRVLKEYRKALDAKELALMSDMADRWLKIEHKLDADILLLAQEIQKRQDEGKSITDQIVYKSQRYQALKAQMEAEIKKYNAEYALSAIEQAQSSYATLGIDAAQKSIQTSIGPLGYNWSRINVKAVESMIGFAGDGSPLNKLLKNDYPDAVEGLTNALVNGIARGLGPATTARNMADGMGMGLERAVLIARTETNRAYRAASTEQYRQSGVVTGYMRLVKKETACMACLMLDGQKLELESDLEDHPGGKCTAIPIIPGVNIKWETGPQWFNKLPPEQQSAKMGSEKFALWQDGQFKLSDLARVKHSDVWGDQPQVATIAQLTEV